jgi:Raf kinase inhibitor-like YbhB/YbcL family protein
MSIILTCTAFKEGERIPSKFTCEGKDVSPQLSWTGNPPDAKSQALIVDDPDAPGGVFTHWVIFNLPADVQQLEEGVPVREKLSNGALQGKNGTGRIGYMGPCPPRGPIHHYRFTLYTLDKKLELKAGSSKEQLLEAMSGHITSQVRLVGVFSR